MPGPSKSSSRRESRMTMCRSRSASPRRTRTRSTTTKESCPATAQIAKVHWRSARMRESRPDHALRLEARALDEPQLVFNGQHRHIDPKAGLELYGPYSLGDASAPLLRQINVGIVAPAALIPSIKAWLDTCRHEVGDV